MFEIFALGEPVCVRHKLNSSEGKSSVKHHTHTPVDEITEIQSNAMMHLHMNPKSMECNFNAQMNASFVFVSCSNSFSIIVENKEKRL